MNLKKLHPDFAEAFLASPAYADKIWQDLPGTRAFYERMREQTVDDLPPVESVITSDHLVPSLAGEPDVPVRFYAPKKHLHQPTGTVVDSWWRLCVGQHA